MLKRLLIVLVYVIGVVLTFVWVPTLTLPIVVGFLLYWLFTGKDVIDETIRWAIFPVVLSGYIIEWIDETDNRN